MLRYIATITVRVEYDAENQSDAETVAKQIGDTVTFPAPRGRAAEIVSVWSGSAWAGTADVRS